MHVKSKAWLGLVAAVLVVPTVSAFTYILNSRTGLPIKWSPATVSIRILLGTTPTLFDGTNYSTSAEAAAQIWNAQIGSMRFQGTITTGTATESNGRNELVFAADVFGTAFETDVLAITTTHYVGNERVESDIVFNNARTWNSYRGSRPGNLPAGTVDIQRVAIHELGHALGMNHPDQAGQQVSAIMNSRISGTDAPTSDDITGAQNLYGPPGVPPNDSFANAIAITLSTTSATVKGHNTNATKQSGEPNHAGNSGGHSVWWQWTALGSGTVNLDTRGSYFDTTLAVYTGSALDSLTAVASNDDISSGVVQASQVSFTSVANTTYYIAVDGFDADSAGISLNLTTDPSVPFIVTQPADQTVFAGDTATFNVTASGAGTLGYQWFFGSTAISGATSATLSIPNAQPANAGSYSVTVTNSLGSVTSNTATLTVNPPNIVPTFTTQPVSQTVTVGTAVTFTAAATGTPAPTYQWRKNGVDLVSATNATFRIDSAGTAHAGTYAVVATNFAGSATSNPATLTVNAPPTPPPSSGGGGGGGAPTEWFFAALTVLALARRLRPRH